jgi:hypothetical protein
MVRPKGVQTVVDVTSPAPHLLPLGSGSLVLFPGPECTAGPYSLLLLLLPLLFIFILRSSERQEGTMKIRHLIFLQPELAVLCQCRRLSRTVLRPAVSWCSCLLCHLSGPSLLALWLHFCFLAPLGTHLSAYTCGRCKARRPQRADPCVIPLCGLFTGDAAVFMTCICQANSSI